MVKSYTTISQAHDQHNFAFTDATTLGELYTFSTYDRVTGKVKVIKVKKNKRRFQLGKQNKILIQNKEWKQKFIAEFDSLKTVRNMSKKKK